MMFLYVKAPRTPLRGAIEIAIIIIIIYIYIYLYYPLL